MSYTVTATTGTDTVGTTGLTATEARNLATCLKFDPRLTVTVTRTDTLVTRIGQWLGWVR